MAKMNFDEMLALLTVLIAPNGEIRTVDLGAGLSVNGNPHGFYEVGRRHARNLEQQGAVRKSRSGHYQITEKGRIAAALVLHKVPMLRRDFIDAWEGAPPEKADPRLSGYGHRLKGDRRYSAAAFAAEGLPDPDPASAS